MQPIFACSILLLYPDPGCGNRRWATGVVPSESGKTEREEEEFRNLLITLLDVGTGNSRVTHRYGSQCNIKPRE